MSTSEAAYGASRQFHLSLEPTFLSRVMRTTPYNHAADKRLRFTSKKIQSIIFLIRNFKHLPIFCHCTVPGRETSKTGFPQA